MGIIRMGIPKDITLFLKQKFNITHFIETGTFHGGTAVWASEEFERVKTIEFSKQIYLTTKNKFDSIKNVEFIYGDSRIELKRIVDSLDLQALFWLDAHWCGLNSYGENDQCPLLEELSLLTESTIPQFILIDDARLFHAPPPLPNSTKYYPDIFEITSVLHKKQTRYTCIFEDVIISVPEFAKESFLHFMQEKTTKAWNDYGKLNNLGRIGKTMVALKQIWLPNSYNI